MPQKEGTVAKCGARRPCFPEERRTSVHITTDYSRTLRTLEGPENQQHLCFACLNEQSILYKSEMREDRTHSTSFSCDNHNTARGVSPLSLILGTPLKILHTPFTGEEPDA